MENIERHKQEGLEAKGLKRDNALGSGAPKPSNAADVTNFFDSKKAVPSSCLQPNPLWPCILSTPTS